MSRRWLARVALIGSVLGSGVEAAPGDIVFEERFNNNGDFVSDWTTSGGGDASVNGLATAAAGNSLALSEDTIAVTTRPGRIDANVPAATLELWIQRGDDAFSENPDAGEDLTVEYLNDSGTWVLLDTYAGSGTPGEILTPSFDLPAEALYSNLQIRVTLVNGSGGGFDFWHIDDVVVTEQSPAITCDTYRDQFDTNAYNNSDGTLDWSASAWIEQDTSGGGATGGLAFVNAGELNLQGNNTTNNTRVVRRADTASATQVTLSFDFSTAGTLEADDAVLIEISGDGGAGFTVLETITGISGSASGSRSYDVTAFAAADMQVRIAIAADDNTGSCCYGGGGETFQVDNLQIEACLLPAVVAEWRLEELVWNGTAGEVLDESGNNLHGRAVAVGGQLPDNNDLDPALSGDPGTCRYGIFDGTSDGHLQIDDNGLLDLPTQLTVTAWIYPRSFPTGGNLQTIASKDENWEFHTNSSGRIFWWWGGGSNQMTSTGAGLGAGNWYHVAISYTSGSQVIYIDGVARGTHNDTGSLTINSDPVFIGTDLGFTSRNFDGFIDEVRVYDQALSQAQVQAVMAERHPCPAGSPFDHFAIDVGAGAASTCVPREITITAEDSSNNKVSNYVGSLTLTTSTDHGRWQNTANPADALGTLTPSGTDDGAASYQFELTGLDDGDIVLALNNTHAETLTIAVTDSGSGAATVSAPLTFSENAFVITATDSLGTDTVARRNHAFHVDMVRRDPATGVCGPAADYNLADVKAWITRDGEDPGGAGPVIQTASESQPLPVAEPGAANLTLPFVGGGADFTLNTTDVGKYTLSFKDDSLSFSDGDIDGGTGSLVVRPFGFDVQAGGNPAAATAGGSVFTTAAANFSVTVRAVGWDSADDANDDGLADGHDDTDPTNNANLSDNLVLTGFGQETPPESVQLTAYLIQPVGGADPGLGDGDASAADGRVLDTFSAGADTTTQVFFAEVGIVELSARVSDGDYLGAGATATARIRGVSGHVGRFIPAGLVIGNTDIVEACAAGGYSYLGEPFTANFRVTAVNGAAAPAVTANYRDDFVKLNTTLGNLGFGAIDQTPTPTLLSGRLMENSTSYSWMAGIGDLSSQLTLDRASAPDGPFALTALGAMATDADGVTVAGFNLDTDDNGTADHVSLGQTGFRFGRLRLDDAHGPELAPLPVTFVTEFFNGSLFTLNNLDSCTAVPLTAVSYPNGSIDIIGNRTVTLAPGATTTGTYGAIGAGNINFTAGDAGHGFSAPGATGSFDVNVDLSTLPWLRFDWDGNGNHTDPALPAATYTFGSYRGHDRVIHWQEVLQ